MLLKGIAGIAILLITIVIAGLSGLSFRLWPTDLVDHPLSVTPDVIQRLRDLQAERKFGLDMATFYPGAPDENRRRMAQAAVDTTIRTLIVELPRRPQRSTVLRVMKTTLAGFDNPESEERDQLLVYLTRVMTICGVGNSSELFNVWRYGFPYGWMSR
jgi:hypothetical protein